MYLFLPAIFRNVRGSARLRGIYSHISGIDLVLGKDGEWYILEDNLRIPSGASYPTDCQRNLPPGISKNFQQQSDRR